jgi:glutathione S-transferase
VELAGAARDYAEAVLALPALKAWMADAVAETERIEKFERDA